MNLFLPDPARFARMAGLAPDGKRDLRLTASISKSTQRKAEEVRQRLGLPNLPALAHFAILHLVDPKKSRAIKVNLQAAQSKKSNSPNSGE